MESLWANYLTQTPQVYIALFFAHFSLLLSWPFFLALEKLSPVNPSVPRSNYWLNWRITLSNLLLAPLFSSAVLVLTLYLASIAKLPSFHISTAGLSVGNSYLDILLQGTVIFFTSCFLGDFSYYWWHRMQHKIPFLWELHKLHHSDEHLNTTTIYRSHFLEPAGQALVRGLTIGLIFDPSDSPQTLLAIIAGALLLVLWDYFIHANVRVDRLHRLLPFFSTPQYHWIHHSKLQQHRDKNFAIWLPLFDIVFGSYYRPKIDEYPPTGLSTGEQFHSVWQAQSSPFIAWTAGLRRRGLPAKRTDKAPTEDIR